MSARTTLATARRVLWQIRRDPRTIALLLVVPTALLILLYFVFEGQPHTFQKIGAALAKIAEQQKGRLTPPAVVDHLRVDAAGV